MNLTTLGIHLGHNVQSCVRYCMCYVLYNAAEQQQIYFNKTTCMRNEIYEPTTFLTIHREYNNKNIYAAYSYGLILYGDIVLDY